MIEAILVGPALIEEQEFRTSLPFLRIPKVFAVQILAELEDPKLQLRHRLVSDDDHEFGQPDQCRGPEPTLSCDEPSVFAGQHRLKLFDLERFTELAEVRLLEVLSRLRADLEPTERFETERVAIVFSFSSRLLSATNRNVGSGSNGGAAGCQIGGGGKCLFP